jgi:hypothetical protein
MGVLGDISEVEPWREGCTQYGLGKVAQFMKADGRVYFMSREGMDRVPRRRRAGITMGSKMAGALYNKERQGMDRIKPDSG